MEYERIIYESYLEKKERKWEAFWVRLIGTRLYFYQEKYVPIPQYHGYLELSETIQCSTHKSKKSNYQFKIKTDKGVYLLQTIVEDERTAWMANILQARNDGIRSISSGNLVSSSSSAKINKHSDHTIRSPRRPSSASGIPASRSADQRHRTRPSSADSPSKSGSILSGSYTNSLKSRGRSVSCNDVPLTQPPPIHLDTHPALRHKHFESKPQNETVKKSRFFSLPGFRQLSKRFSRSQDNVGDTRMRHKEELGATRATRTGSLNLDLPPGGHESPANILNLDRATESKGSSNFIFEFLEPHKGHHRHKGFPPRSASLCSDQSEASRVSESESAVSTRSLDRKHIKRHRKEFSENNLNDSEKRTNILSKKGGKQNCEDRGVNKLSGIRCHISGGQLEPHYKEPTNQKAPPYEPGKSGAYYKSPSSNKPVNEHSNVVARKPPTTKNSSVNEVHQSDSGVSPVKPPLPSKRHSGRQNEVKNDQTNERHRSERSSKEMDSRRQRHKLELSSVDSGRKENIISNGPSFVQDAIGQEVRDTPNRSKHKKNPFYENETTLYSAFSWFHGDLTREDSENLLKFCGKIGSFLIRNSKKHSKHICLSLRYSDRIRHFKIDRSLYGYSIDGLEGYYTDLNKLVEVFISWNDNMVTPLNKAMNSQELSTGIQLESESSLIYEDMSDDVI